MTRLVDQIFAERFQLRVRRLREAAGYTQVEMARKLGLTPAAYAKYETRSMLPLRLFRRFTRLTGTDLDFLVGGEPGRTPQP